MTTTKTARDLQPGDRIPFTRGYANDYRTIEHVEQRGKTMLVFAGGSGVPLRLSAISQILVEVMS